jgi:hypothetical protein
MDLPAVALELYHYGADENIPDAEGDTPQVRLENIILPLTALSMLAYIRTFSPQAIDPEDTDHAVFIFTQKNHPFPPRFDHLCRCHGYLGVFPFR